MQHADVILIGSGQGGVPLAAGFAEEGRQVVLFERARFGGTCVNYGCLPSKAFLASAHAAAAARNADKLGIRASVEVDFPRVMQRARETIDNSSDGVRKRLANAGVQLVEAEASFLNEDTVRGGDTEVRAPLIVINSGNSSAVPPISGLDNIDFFTYESFWQLKTLPKRTLVLGGGYVGVELGQGLARLGSDTYVIERSDRIVAREEKDVSHLLMDALERDGVHIHTRTEVSEVRRRDGAIEVLMKDIRPGRGAGGSDLSMSQHTLPVDALLVATGRKPNTAALNADAANIELDEKGHVKVDERFRTTNPNVYAIGDVTGQPQFTHVSWEDHRRLRSILNDGDRTQRDRTLGYVFFTEPQVGRVGLTLQEALDRGYDADSATLPLENVTRANLTEAEPGFYRMVIDRQSGKILGATLAGPAAGELVHVFMAHIEAGSTWRVLEQSVHVHPTFAEGLPVLARKFADTG